MDLTVKGTEEDIPHPDPSQTLEEYLQQLNDQFADINRVVNPEMVNGEPFRPDFNDWTPDEIDQLELTVQPIEDLVVDSLVELAEYLDRALENFPEILEELRESDDPDVSIHRDQLQEAFVVINQILTSVIGSISIDERLKTIKQINERVKTLHDDLEEKEGKELVSVFKSSQELFTELRREIQTIVQLLAQREESLWEGVTDLHDQVEGWVQSIPDLVNDLQSEPDAEHYNQIEALTNHLSDVLEFIEDLDRAGKLKLVMTPEEQDQLNEANVELDRGLGELNQAFENKDVIMICDILEYEILPYLKDIGEFIGELSAEVDS